MKVSTKQKIQKIDGWLDELRDREKIESSEKDNITIVLGNSKVFLDKNNRNNDKILIDYIIIKRSEIAMLDTRIVDAIYKLATIEG